MSENPLLPHRKLQELYTLIKRSRALERRQRSKTFSREAILAAVAIHLEAGDFLAAQPGDASAVALAAEANFTTGGATPTATPRFSRLALAAAIARGQQVSANGRLTLALTEAGTSEPGWQDALTWAQKQRLPFILLCADAIQSTGPDFRPRKAATALAWPEIERVCHRLQLPTLSVDGEDAVALYRVVQESVLRARTGAGPAVIWASIPAANNSTAVLPLERLRRYLKARNIALPA